MDWGSLPSDLVLRARIIRQLFTDRVSLGAVLSLSRRWRNALPFTIALQALDFFDVFGTIPQTVWEPGHLPAFLRDPALAHMRARLGSV